MKRLLSIILDIFMLLLLAGCEGGCTENTSLVQVSNLSHVAVKAEIVNSANDSLGYQVIAPGETVEIHAMEDEFVFTAVVQPLDDWLSYATAKRDALVDAFTRQAPDSAQANTLKTELQELRDKIQHYQQAPKKMCQGEILPFDSFKASQVIVTDSKSDNSITVACYTPDSDNGE